MSESVKGFGCRPLEGRRRVFGGRRPKASKGGNRAGGTKDVAAGTTKVASRRKQPSDDHEDRLWGFNVQRHLYFQWLGCSKNNTPHNLDVRSSVFESHEAN